jgi:hypothetical protein
MTLGYMERHYKREANNVLHGSLWLCGTTNSYLVEMLSTGYVSRREDCLPIFNSVAGLLNPLDKCISCCITLDTNLPSAS